MEDWGSPAVSNGYPPIGLLVIERYSWAPNILLGLENGNKGTTVKRGPCLFPEQ